MVSYNARTALQTLLQTLTVTADDGVTVLSTDGSSGSNKVISVLLHPNNVEKDAQTPLIMIGPVLATPVDVKTIGATLREYRQKIQVRVLCRDSNQSIQWTGDTMREKMLEAIDQLLQNNQTNLDGVGTFYFSYVDDMRTDLDDADTPPAVLCKSIVAVEAWWWKHV